MASFDISDKISSNFSEDFLIRKFFSTTENRCNDFSKIKSMLFNFLMIF